MKKRILSFLLAFVLACLMLPATANAEEYTSGPVKIFDLEKGDVIHAGVTVEGYPDLPFSIYRTPGPNEPISAYPVAVGVKSWTADKNYYVVWDGDSIRLLVYPTSDITFYPSGGTAGGTTAPLTFLAVKETDRYYDVSWLNPKRPGCTFLGWYTSDGKEQVYDANGKAVNGTYWKNNLWQGQGAKSLIAKWAPKTSVTFRYFPNGGTGQPDNFVQWKADATYFDTYPSDSHWNYTTGTYKLTRVGYTATGNYAKKDGSCVVHEDQMFTSYSQLCAAYGLNPDTCGNATVDIYAQWAPINYTVTFNGNGGSGTMANQSFAYDTPQALKPNAFERVYTVTYNENGGAELPDGKAVATFNGWQDRGSIVYKDGTTYTFADFDGAGYGLRNNDVFVSSGFGNGIFNKYGLLDHYVIYGKGEYANGSAGRAPTTDKPYGYPDGATVSNLSTTNGATVPLYALWTPGSVTLPTPTKAGHTFNGWYTEATGGTKVGVAGASYTPAANTTLYAQWTANTYTVTWKNHDGSVLETDTGVVYGTTPTYNGATPQRAEDEHFTYTFDDWSPTVSAVTGDAEYTAQFTAVSKRVDPTYTVTIPAAVNEGESFQVSATGVVLNTDQTLTVTLQSDFKLRNKQNVELAFQINGGDIGNNAVVLSITGNGDKNTPLAKDSDLLTAEVTEEVRYAGTYTGRVIFTIAVNTAEQTQ